MIAAPWNVILTIVFAVTLGICLVEVVRHRRQAPSDSTGDSPRQKVSTGEIVHISHAIMSIAMIGMAWSMQNQTLMWIQVVIFAALVLWHLPSLLGATGQSRIDLISHLVLHAAMIWMLAAMELLMAEMSHGSSGGSDDGSMDDMDGMDSMDSMDGMDMSGSAGTTPMWADIVNWFFVAASALVALWWLKRLIETRSIHALCHTLMGAGMALMLVLMN